MEKIVLMDGNVKRDLILFKCIPVIKKEIQLFVVNRQIANDIKASSIFTGGESHDS